MGPPKICNAAIKIHNNLIYTGYTGWKCYIVSILLPKYLKRWEKRKGPAFARYVRSLL